MKKIVLSLFTALLLACLFTPGLQADEEDFAKDMAQWAETFSEHASKNAEAMTKNAEAMTKHMQEQQKHLQTQMKHLEQQMKETMPKFQERLGRSLAMMDQFDINIHIPDIPPIPNLPPIPNISNVGSFEDNFDGEIVEDTIEKKFDVDADTTLKVDSIFSSIRIEPGDSDSQVAVTIHRKTGAETKEAAKELMEYYEITTEQTRNAVEITITFNKDGKKKSIQQNKTTMHCDVVVLVPQKTSVELRNSFGDAIVRKIRGDIRTDNKFGNTYVLNTKGDLNAVSTYGQLSIQEHDGNASVKGKLGDSIVNGLTGNLTINVGYGKAKISSARDDAQIDGNVSFGETSINLPENYSGRIEAISSFGEIKAPKDLSKKKKMFNESVEGDIGGGKGLVKIKNSYAPIEISLGKDIFAKVKDKAVDLSIKTSKRIDKAMGKDKPDARCEGVVLDAKTGKAIPNAKVEAYYSNDPPYAEASVDENGEYHFKVWSEEHYVKASAPGYKEKSSLVDTGFFQRKKEIKVNFLLDPN